MSLPPAPALFAHWLGAPPAPAYLLAGEGARLAELLAQAWKERVESSGRSAGLARITPQDWDRESPVPSFRTPSFFEDRRIFLLPDLSELKKGPKAELSEYLSSPDPGALLVIPSSDPRQARTWSGLPSVRSMAPGEDQVVAALAESAEAIVSRSGRRISREASTFLARWVGEDYPRFRAELGKLLSFAGEEEIGEEAIRAVCVAGSGVDPFRLADDLIEGNARECLEAFRRFAARTDPSGYHALLGAIAWKARRRIGGGGGRAPSPGRGIARSVRVLAALSGVDRRLKGESGLSPEQVFEIELLRLLCG